MNLAADIFGGMIMLLVVIGVGWTHPLTNLDPEGEPIQVTLARFWKWLRK